MKGLPNFPGGNNGFATGANNLGQVVGWAENGVHDPTCCCTQVLQFRPAVWTLGPPDQIQDLPLISGDSSGAATAINDNGQIVGISGICDQAVGRHSAKHAVLWENGTVTDIYPDPPAPWWIWINIRHGAIFPKHGVLGRMSSNGLVADTGDAHDLTIVIDRC